MTKWIATLLPLEARDILRAAAKKDPGVPPGESVLRRDFVDGAIDTVRRRFPRYFRQEVAVQTQ